MKKRLVLFIFLAIVWTLLCWPPEPQHMIVGLVVCVSIALIAGGLFITRPHVFVHPTRYIYFVQFLPVFIWECIKANVDVAYRVIHPGLPIKPGIVKVKTSLKSETGLTFLANAITLTPGTMTVDIDREGGFLYVHWISVKTQNMEEATQFIVKRFEKILMKIFE